MESDSSLSSSLTRSSTGAASAADEGADGGSSAASSTDNSQRTVDPLSPAAIQESSYSSSPDGTSPLKRFKYIEDDPEVCMVLLQLICKLII